MPRAFVIAPTPELIDALVQSLATGFAVEGASDPRAIKDFAARGRVDAVLVTENVTQPPAPQIAAALGPALPDTAFLLVSREIRATDDTGPFHGQVTFPIDPRVLVSKVRRTIRGLRQAESDLREVRALVEMRTIGLDDKNHYEVLGVATDAGVDEITRAYDALSLTFHPDRLRRLDEETRAHGMQFYLRVGQAYRTLRSASARIRYDHALEAGTHAESLTESGAGMLRSLDELSRVPAARKYLSLAQKALASGDRKMAIAHLRFALSLDEGNALVRKKLTEIEVSGG